MKDYIPLTIIVSLASIGMICIIVDMIIGSTCDEDGIIVKSSQPKTEQYQTDEDYADTAIDYEDDLIINE
jgi:hypothetical protein